MKIKKSQGEGHRKERWWIEGKKKKRGKRANWNESFMHRTKKHNQQSKLFVFTNLKKSLVRSMSATGY